MLNGFAIGQEKIRSDSAAVERHGYVDRLVDESGRSERVAKRLEAHLWQRLTWTSKTMTVHVALGGASGSSAVPDFVHPVRTARPEATSVESGLDAVADAIAKARRIVVVCGTSAMHVLSMEYCLNIT